MKATLAVSLASIACATVLAGCVTTAPGQLAVTPIMSGAPYPPPPMIAAEVYQPMPDDIYISTVTDRDVVFFGGDTYIWVIGPDGMRHRHFYAHGDRRGDVFHRRDELHRVMINHGGHLPDHALASHGPMPMQRPGGPVHPLPGPLPVAHAAVQGRPIPVARPTAKDSKKS